MDMLEAITRIMDKHRTAVDDEDGGERPFNEPGETLEAIDNILEGRIEYVTNCGWFN